MELAPEKPLFSMYNVDVTLLDPNEKVLGLLVHVKCFDTELQSEPVKEKARASVKWALNYLVKEGFVPSVTGWNVGVGIIGSNPD
jgi:hypothetical protein